MARLPPPLGRRGEALRRAVLDAAMIEIATSGYDASVQAVALRAGVHETSIYRRWQTREALLLDALIDRIGVDVPVPDTGSLEEDLVAIAQAVAVFDQSPVGKTLLRVVGQASAEHDSELQAFWIARRDALTVVIERAQDRGELDSDADPRLILEMLVAPLHFRTLLTRESIDPTLPRQLARLIIGSVQQW